MPEPRYHIIFSTLIEGRQPVQVYQDLADLFKIDQELVQQIFACQGAVVKRDLDRTAAEQYVQIILAAGAICVIEPMPSDTSPAAAEDGPEPAPPSSDLEKNAGSPTPEAQQQESHFRLEADSDALERSGIVRTPTIAVLMLLAGACVPLLSDSGQLQWPWQFGFEPQPPGLLWWTLLPVAAAVLIALLRDPAMSLIIFFAGTAALLISTVVLWEAALIIPLRIMPLDRSDALLYALPLLGAAICSASCSAMEDLGELIMLRLLTACGSLAILIPVIGALFASGSIWERWPLILLLLLLLLYAVLTLVCACLPAVPEHVLSQVRLLRVLLLCWAPVAVFLVHLPLSEPETGKALFTAVLKTVLLYYGALAAITGGLRNEFLYRFEKQP